MTALDVLWVGLGGGLGAMLREFVMLMVPNPVDGFPLDILVANLVAAFLLGLVTALHGRRVLSDDVYMLLGAGTWVECRRFRALSMAVWC